MRSIFIFLLTLTATATLATAADRPGQAEIDYLLQSMESSGCHFIRNGTEYEGKVAAEHLRTKLEHAGSSVQTVDDFIEGIATKSSVSGQPYQVKKPDGTTIPANTWLREELKARSK